MKLSLASACATPVACPENPGLVPAERSLKIRLEKPLVAGSARYSGELMSGPLFASTCVMVIFVPLASALRLAALAHARGR
jgi:hypothetical protein